jgi:hypothetical protein
MIMMIARRATKSPLQWPSPLQHRQKKRGKTAA